MNFKFFKGDEDEMGRLFVLNPVQFANAEFCFQFDDEEPQIFATGMNQCTITLNPTQNGNMTFTKNGRTFKLFARERINQNEA